MHGMFLHFCVFVRTHSPPQRQSAEQRNHQYKPPHSGKPQVTIGRYEQFRTGPRLSQRSSQHSIQRSTQPTIRAATHSGYRWRRVHWRKLRARGGAQPSAGPYDCFGCAHVCRQTRESRWCAGREPDLCAWQYLRCRACGIPVFWAEPTLSSRSTPDWRHCALRRRIA